MLNLTGTISNISEVSTKNGFFNRYTIVDGFTYRLTDFSGILNRYKVGDKVDVSVRVIANIYNGKTFVQYTC